MSGIGPVTFDQPVYHQGDLITATVPYTGARAILNLSGILAGSAIQGTGTFVILPQWSLTDGSARVWVLKSDDGSTAVFTALA